MSANEHAINDKTKKLIDDYFKQRSEADEKIGDHINNKIVQFIFELLIKLAYTLFTLGFALSIAAGSDLDPKRLVAYINTTYRPVLLALIILMMLVNLSISEVFAKSKALTTRQRRDLDLVVDVLRVVIYVLMVVFLAPYIQQTEDTLKIAGFWAMVAAAVLFLVRKVLKWVHFLVVQKDDLTPWENYVYLSPLTIQQFIEFQQFLQKNAPPPRPAPPQPAPPALFAPTQPAHPAQPAPTGFTSFLPELQRRY